ncbi:MAG: NifB/NifX family molybdenum-iron cluster-binding protein [Thermoanaerobaculia bacterium]
MKICIPTDDDRGLLSSLSPHFGRAAYLTVVDLESGAVEAFANGHDDSRHGHCDPATRVREHGARVVICGGLGRRALASLTEAGVRVFLTSETLSREAARAFSEGRTEEASSAGVCSGGHADAGCGHHG